MTAGEIVVALVAWVLASIVIGLVLGRYLRERQPGCRS